MGNNTLSTRKLAAAAHATGVHLLRHQNLEEEFSDLILHEVKREAERAQKDFSDDLIEDEFNELNDGLLELETAEVVRNIIPADGDVEMSASDSELVPRDVPVEIKWVNSRKENIQKIAIIGSFSQWRDVIKLKPSAHENEYLTTVTLPLGVHKLLYIINNEYRVSEQLPTATDQQGIFFNWFEVLDPKRLFNNSHTQPHENALTAFDANIIQVAGQRDTLAIQQKSTELLEQLQQEEKEEFTHVEDVYVAPPGPEYSSEIPEMFLNYDYFKQRDYELPEPPQLPAHLNNVLLNKISVSQANSDRPPLRRADSLYYALNQQAYHQVKPNHVILNHLMTTLIRHDVLTVACITRYLGKFVTQIMHSPA